MEYLFKLENFKPYYDRHKYMYFLKLNEADNEVYVCRTEYSYVKRKREQIEQQQQV